MSSALQMQSVITRLNGGLGNQLFQYAAGRALADRLGVPLKLDLSEFETYLLRRFELDQFNINAGIATLCNLESGIRLPYVIRCLLPNALNLKTAVVGARFIGRFGSLLSPDESGSYKKPHPKGEL